MIQSHLLAKSQYLNHSTASFDILVSHYERLLIEKFEKTKILIEKISKLVLIKN
jgi:hypothetical protein